MNKDFLKNNDVEIVAGIIAVLAVILLFTVVPSL